MDTQRLLLQRYSLFVRRSSNGQSFEMREFLQCQDYLARMLAIRKF